RRSTAASTLGDLDPGRRMPGCRCSGRATGKLRWRRAIAGPARAAGGENMTPLSRWRVPDAFVSKCAAPMDLANKLGDPARVDASLSDLARGVVGSEILRIAAEIRSLKAAGGEICNLTVGDFDPAQFPAPAALLDGMRAALAAGQTNSPPSGVAA